MNIEQSSHFSDQTRRILNPWTVVSEAVNGTAAPDWKNPEAHIKLKLMVTEAMETILTSCGEKKWSGIGSYTEEGKLHVTHREKDGPISILDPQEIAGLGVKSHSASNALRAAFTNAVLMFGSNLKSLAELRELQERRGRYGQAATPKKTSPKMSASLR